VSRIKIGPKAADLQSGPSLSPIEKVILKVYTYKNKNSLADKETVDQVSSNQ